MLDGILNAWDSIKNIFTPILIITPIVYSFSNVFDFLFDNILSYDNLLPHDEFVVPLTPYENAVFNLNNNFKYLYNMNSLDFINNVENINNVESYFQSVKIIIIENRHNNFDFFLNRMKGEIKESYVSLLNSVNEDTTFNEFSKKKYSKNFLYILNKKIIN